MYDLSAAQYIDVIPEEFYLSDVMWLLNPISKGSFMQAEVTYEIRRPDSIGDYIRP